MEDNLLNTPEKIELAIVNCTDLQRHPGWLLVKSIVDVNIQILTDKILIGGESEEVMNRLRDRLMVHKEIIGTPADIIEKNKTPTSPVPSFDPYEKPKKLDKDIE